MSDLTGGTKYELKAKRADNQKWWCMGSLSENQYGNWRIGMRNTKELRDMLDAAGDGGWVNLSVFEPREQQHTKAKQDGFKRDDFEDQSIPF